MRIDHVVVAVPDLPATAAQLTALGFTQKAGRLHANGLLNAHVEFADGTEIELMTVVDGARDAMAEDYARILEEGGGGAFLALVASRDVASRAAEEGRVAARLLDAGPFRYLTFPGEGMSAVFVMEYAPSSDPDPAGVTHANGAAGVFEVWVEASDELERLLLGLGAAGCGPALGPKGERGRAFGVANGAVVVVEPGGPGRSHVLGAGIHAAAPSWTGPVEPVGANGFWLSLARNPSG